MTQAHHADTRRRPSTARLLITMVLILVCVSAVTALGLSSARNSDPAAPRVPAPWEYNTVTNKHWHPEHGHWHDGPPPAAGAASALSDGTAPVTLSSSDVSLAGTTPQPWEYNPDTNKHWHAEHGHWHDGPPPAAGDAAAAARSTPPITVAPSAAGASGTTPQPWEYNPATNQYWHPDHGHWHDGQPPAPADR